MGTPVPAVTEPSHTPPAIECLPSPVSPPPPRGLTLTPLPSSSEPEPPLWDGRIRSWDWIRVRIPHHRIRQESQPQAAAVLLRYPGIRSLRGHGSLLFDDGLPSTFCILRCPGVFLCDCCHLALRG